MSLADALNTALKETISGTGTLMDRHLAKMDKADREAFEKAILSPIANETLAEYLTANGYPIGGSTLGKWRAKWKRAHNG